MKILAVEDESILLRQLANQICEALPGTDILAFDNADDASTNNDGVNSWFAIGY